MIIKERLYERRLENMDERLRALASVRDTNPTLQKVVEVEKKILMDNEKGKRWEEVENQIEELKA